MIQVQSNEHLENFPANSWSEEGVSAMGGWREALALWSRKGFGGMAQAQAFLINEAIKL